MKLLPYVCIWASFAIASMVNVYPVSLQVAELRPMVLVLVLGFWAMYEPYRLGVGSAFLVGLVADLLFDTHLGQQAFCCVVMVFFLRVVTRYTKHLSFGAAWVLAFFAFSIFRFLLWFLQSFGQSHSALIGWGAYMATLIIFPVVWLMLSYVQTKYRHIAP